MGIWIRSQDKKDLVLCKDVSLCKCGIIANYNLVNGEESYSMLGTYATEDNALKVLDRIQERIEESFIYESRMSYTQQTNIHSKKVFQMPLDERRTK